MTTDIHVQDNEVSSGHFFHSCRGYDAAPRNRNSNTTVINLMGKPEQSSKPWCWLFQNTLGSLSKPSNHPCPTDTHLTKSLVGCRVWSHLLHPKAPSQALLSKPSTRHFPGRGNQENSPGFKGPAPSSSHVGSRGHTWLSLSKFSQVPRLTQR